MQITTWGCVIKLLDGLINHFQGSDPYSISWYRDQNSAQDSVIQDKRIDTKSNLKLFPDFLTNEAAFAPLFANVFDGMQGYWEAKLNKILFEQVVAVLEAFIAGIQKQRKRIEELQDTLRNLRQFYQSREGSSPKQGTIRSFY